MSVTRRTKPITVKSATKSTTISKKVAKSKSIRKVVKKSSLSTKIKKEKMEVEAKKATEKLKTSLTDFSSEKELSEEDKMKKKVETREIIKDIPKGTHVTLNGYFEVETGLFKILLSNIQSNRNTMLLGPTGTGKTELAKNIADYLGLPFTVFDMGTMSDPITSLIGTHTIRIKDGVSTSEFIPSRFSQVIQQPGIVLLDELSRASLTANNILFPCLDYRRELPMEYCFSDSLPVKIHPNCVFIATANVGSQYTGTHRLDRALIDRFMLIEVDGLGPDELIKVAKEYVGDSVAMSKIKTIVDTFTSINKRHAEFKITFNFSIRHLKNVLDLVADDFTIYDAYYSIAKGLASTDGVAVVKELLNEKI